MIEGKAPKLWERLIQEHTVREIARMTPEELDYRKRCHLELLKCQRNIFLRQIGDINKSFLKRFFLKDEIEYINGALETIDRQMREIEFSEMDKRTATIEKAREMAAEDWLMLRHQPLPVVKRAMEMEEEAEKRAEAQIRGIEPIDYQLWPKFYPVLTALKICEMEMRINPQLKNAYEAIMRDVERYSFGLSTPQGYIKAIEVKRLTSLLTKNGETKMKFEVKQTKEVEVKDEPTTLELVKEGDGRVVVIARKGAIYQTIISFQNGKFKRWELDRAKADYLGIVYNSKGLIQEE